VPKPKHTVGKNVGTFPALDASRLIPGGGKNDCNRK